MQLSNDIVLRPRFKKSLAFPAETVLTSFEKIASSNKDFKISRIDNHVFIRIPKNKQHFWSPQLHLEIEDDPTIGTILKGLFGPNPAVWTMFMFFHFIVVALFIASCVWMYTNISLEKPYGNQLVIMILTIIIWFVLYFSGRLGKKAGEKEMKQLYKFMRDVFSTIQ